jgi:MFS family permease
LPTPAVVYPKPAYAWYVVALLTTTYIAAYIDRYLLSLLIEPIKANLTLSDLQIGLLLGPAFSVLFVTLGLPLGWLADRKNRSKLLAIGIALWSLMTAACGLAKSFVGLFIARIGVGIGEATAAPCSVSLIGDYFAVETRPRAIAMWMAGAPVGAGMTYILGGQVIEMIREAPPWVLPIIGELQSWQAAFLAIGIPGLVLSLLVAMTVREPKRQEKGSFGNSGENPTLRQAIAFFRQQIRSYLSVFIGIIGISAIGASSFWTPALFQRNWGWDVGATGLAVGAVLLITGTTGTTLGGWLAARWVKNNVRHGAYLTVFIGTVIVFPAFTLFPLMPTAEAAVAMLFLGFMGMSITSGTSPTAVITITPSQLRGQMTALFFLVINLFGGLVGPPMVGLIADAMGGPQQLKYGMAITCGSFGLIMNLALWWGLKHYRQSAIDMARSLEAAPS